jgi:hypothetical protein
MSWWRCLGSGIVFTVCSILGSVEVHAICLLTNISVTPSAASVGTYTPPNAPSAQPINITVSGSYLATLGDLGGSCALAVAFDRTTLPASMSLTAGGTAALPYVLQTAAGGGSSLLNSGGGTPVNFLMLTFPASLMSLSSFNVSGTIWALAQPVDPQQAGTYQDSLTVKVYPSSVLGVLQPGPSSQGFVVTGQVSKSCTIGGVAHPSTDTVNIPIGADGRVNVSPINRSYANALCNTPTSLQLSSQNGAVTTGTSHSGLQNFIDYMAAANFSGAAASLDTATNPAASGPENGAAVLASGSTPSGTLSVTITPEANAKQLVAGSYQDTLTISLVPQ